MSELGAVSGLIVDWGGVLTGDIRTAVERWAAVEDIDLGIYVSIMREWLGEGGAVEARINPIHALERGEVEVPEFEQRLAQELTRRTGRPHRSDGLIARMFDHFQHAPEMTALVRRAHGLGIRTALLSNSWGNPYPPDLWDGMFDVVVISGEVGMRKPEPEIFTLTLDNLDMRAESCVFVDDLAVNIAAAADLGMVGVLHRSYDETRMELQAVFGVDLA